MARWYLTGFTTGKRYPLFNALKKAFILKTMADRHTFLGEYKYHNDFDKTFKECIEFVRDIHDIDPINGLDQLRMTLAIEKYRAKNQIPRGQEIVFEDLQYKDYFPGNLHNEEKEDWDLLKEMVEDSRDANKEEVQKVVKNKSFYERVSGLKEIICSSEIQTSKFDEYSCDPKYWS